MIKESIYQTITCHFCFQTFEVNLEVSEAFSGHNSEVYDCVVCCNPNKIDYEVHDGVVIDIILSDGNA